MAEVHLPHAAHDEGNVEVHHETSDANIRGILVFAAGLIVVAFVIHVGVWVLFRFMDTHQARSAGLEYPLAAAAETRLPPEPRLQTNPREDLRQMRDQETRLLTSYGWVDKNSGVVRIPIDEAMKLTVQRGLPARQQEGTKR